ncbi:MAG TPA: PEGA domain-containing protein [Candidatus Sulfobium mesophilum]|nr:PEGA domain-containing protein [Candidatus Sulfobium mesophilum]
MRKRILLSKMVVIFSLFMAMSLFQVTYISNAQEKAAQQVQESELIIVKYGSVSVRSLTPDAKVFIDDVYKGAAENTIESVIVGDHVISCRTENKTVSSTFTVKKNETLLLEARFDEGKLIVITVPEKKAEQIEVEKKKAEPVRQEKPKKPVPVVIVKREEPKDPQEEWRKMHLTTMQIYFEITPSQEIQIFHKANLAVISKYTENKNLTGRYYRTKQNVLLCDAGPCEMGWSATFLYMDEAGKSDAFLLNWKEIIFNGITPTGTSKRVLEWCLGGVCRKLEDTGAADTEREQEIGRYILKWTKTSVIIRRADVIIESVAAGKSLSDY